MIIDNPTSDTKFVYIVCILLLDYRQLEHGMSIAAMLVVKRLGSYFIASKNPGYVYITGGTSSGELKN